jgi:hypothetical protein
MTLSLLVPTSEPSSPIIPYALSIEPEAFNGVMGFIANSQPGSIEFLGCLASRVMPRLGMRARAHFEDKGPTPARSGVPMTADEADIAAKACGAAILAYGHCGGCTAATIRDAVALAKRGVPVVALVVPYFEPSARQLAHALRMPDLPIHVLSGPMARKNQDERAAIAAAELDAILALFKDRTLRVAA